jgi:hypothetical protein
VIPTPNTLDANEAKRLARIPSGPKGCLPPCWNGLTPEESPASDIPTFLARLGIAYSDSSNGLDEHDHTLHYTSSNLPEVELYYLFMRIHWRDQIESISLNYQYFPDIYGEMSYLHPKNLIELLGPPDYAKIWIYKDWGGGIGLNFSEHHLAVSYSADIIRTSEGEPLLCLVETKEDPRITVLLYDEEHDHEERFFRPDMYQDQEIYTGLLLFDFIAELVIPRRCIPIQLTD